MAQAGRPSAGDFTGRQKAQAAKEQRVATAERAAETTMITAEQDLAEQNGVFDPKTGEQVNDSGSYTAFLVEETPTAYAQETVLTGKEDPEQVAAVISSKKIFTSSPATVLQSPKVTIRVDMDVEDMTYGFVNGEPNNYTFKEGLAYEVPREVAEHLNDRGLVRQWIKG